MKKFSYIIAASLMSMGLASCSDLLDVNSTTQLSDVAIWNSEEAAEGYVIASYQTFTDHANVHNIALGSNPNRFYDAFSDIIKSTSWDQNDHLYNKSLMLSTTFGKNNGGTFGVWNDEYGRIKRANILLNDIDRYGVSRYGEEWCEVRRAEARFCNAINYFFLARAYGGVIIRTHESGKTGLTDDGKYPEDCNRARVSEKETYDYIIKELNWAIERLPQTWVNDKYKEKYLGRATKAIAYGFLSRIALYAACVDGLTDEQKKEYYDIVIDAADKCKQLGDYGLVSNYSHLFSPDNEKENRKEIIYAMYGLQKYKVNDYDTYVRPVGDAAVYNTAISALFVPTAELADMYEFKDGTSIDWNDWEWDHDDPFTDREPRFHATILYNGAKWENRTIQTYVGLDTRNKTDYGTDYFVEYENARSTDGHTCTGYYLKKFLLEGKSEFTTERSWNNDIVLRYAEVLLNKAEAYAMTNRYQEALDAVNEIRARVELPAKKISQFGNQDAMMELIRRERCCELAGEGLRYWDIRRWKIADKVINGQNVHGCKITRNSSGILTYETVDADGGNKRIFQDRYYKFSIPAAELTNNNLCVDNPGW